MVFAMYVVGKITSQGVFGLRKDLIPQRKFIRPCTAQ